MEFSNFPILSTSNPRISTTVTFTPKFSIKTSNNKRTYIFNKPTSKFPRKRSFPYYLFSSNTTTLQISAQSGRPTSRRNSLRKKLLNDQQVNKNNPISLNTSSIFENIENLNYDCGKGSVNDGMVEKTSFKESKLKPVGESVLFSKLENWIDQYKKDVDYWGIGSGQIFTVFEDSEGNVKRVVVNEDEILKRSQVERHAFEGLTEVNSRMMYAKTLAKEMESGENVIPRNSSVAKFVISGEESGFVNVIRDVILRPDFIPKLSRVGSVVLCGLVVFWVVKKLFSFGNKEVHYTELEKEMMRRKIKSRKNKEMLEKESVEVVQEAMEPPMGTFVRPQIDKQELMKNITKAKASKDNLASVDSYISQTSKSEDFGDKILEIRKMASQIREIVGGEVDNDRDEEEKQAVDDELSDEIEEIEQHREDYMSFLGNIPNGSLKRGIDTDGTSITVSLVDTKSQDTELPSKVASVENGYVQTSSTSNGKISEDTVRTNQDSKSTSCVEIKEDVQSSDTVGAESMISETTSIRIKPKPRVICSVKEAREFLSEKQNKKDFDQPIVQNLQEDAAVSRHPSDKESDRNSSHTFNADNKVFQPTIFGGTSESTLATNAHESSTLKDEEHVPINKDDHECSDEGYRVGDHQMSPGSIDCEGVGVSTKTGPYVKMENWMEENFLDIEPIAKMIGMGFRDNFMVAREKVNKQLNTYADITQLSPSDDESELEWMIDDRLRDIVFQVRENELAGRDPFYLMDAEDKLAFFQGLEKKVEKENEKLSHVHEWLHSNIENLDYGADGISLYDPPEKIIPRWKGPPLEKSPEFMDDFLKQREGLFTGNTGTSYPVKKDEGNFLQNPTGFPTLENATSMATNDLKLQDEDPKHSKTVIDGSDGSVRSGKKSGKEYWQHTKKWSHGFLESYNAETDPEVKSIMKDMGKDLDRWITEEEIQDAADLMTKLPERNKKFMEKKLNKLKREMELFGPQAIVSKYREYSEEKEEDYLWWLDLPHVLCIELYTNVDGEQRIGFYSLEMATDLELEPKPHHVIAFENAQDCKNLCYIIQAHLEMLGDGHAFVIARPPKDAFREAKANGFSVTVIRRGELQLNIDQPLEEVEEKITEIGSKIYHDKIMGERSVDVSSLMKGVFGFGGKSSKSKRAKNRAKRKLKRPSKK